MRLAWRNIWRNRRRSILTIASIGFGLSAVIFAQSLMKTIQWQMTEKSSGMLTGHLQVQARKVKDRKVPELSFARPAEIERALSQDPRVKGVRAPSRGDG